MVVAAHMVAEKPVAHHKVGPHTQAELRRCYNQMVEHEGLQNQAEYSQSGQVVAEVDTQTAQGQTGHNLLVHWVTVVFDHKMAGWLEVSEPEAVHSLGHNQVELLPDYHSLLEKLGAFHSLAEWFLVKGNYQDLG